MTTAQFFEKFDLIADAPDAVAKMRSLILELAVQGRLVSQEDEDESAEKLAERITAQRLRLIKKGTFGKLTNFDPIAEAAQPYKIPESWAWVPLGNVTFIRTGKLDANASSPDGKYPFFTCAKEPLRIDRFAYDGECVLLAGNGNFDVNYYDGKFEAYQRTYIIEGVSRDLIDGRYLFRFVQNYADTLRQMSVGGVISYIKIGFLTGAPLPLPPIAEQKRIVAKVDELMALCDQLEAQQQERETKHTALAQATLGRFAEDPTPTNLNLLFHSSFSIQPSDLRKTILTLAVQGKLVPQDPNDEPANALVARITAEKRCLVQTRQIKQESPLSPISDEEVFTIPKSWTWVRAGDLCRPISSGSTPDKSVFSPSEGIPYLKVYNIRNQAVDFDYKPQFIAVSHHEKQMKRSRLLPGDLIMNIVGPPLGKVALVPDTFPEWNCNQAIAFFRPIFFELATYLYTFLKEGSFLRNIQLIGTAGQDNISVTKCKFIPIPLPPLAEQKRIVAKVEELMALVDALEAQQAAAGKAATHLLDAVVSELAAAA